VAHTPFTELLQEDLASLETNLRDLLAPHLSKKDHLSLLNLACGRGDETGVLAKLLSEKSKSSHLQGLDIRAAEIDQANSRWKDELQKTKEQNNSVDFITHRGDRLLDLAEIGTPDIAFLRHQNYWNDKPVWTQIFDQALERLNDDGLLVITSYFDKEHELATEALTNLGAIQVGSIINPNSRTLSDAPGKSVDKHLAIFKKTSA
jgi:chemotaxis methyl-accepting protein methylase